MRPILIEKNSHILVLLHPQELTPTQHPTVSIKMAIPFLKCNGFSYNAKTVERSFVQHGALMYGSENVPYDFTLNARTYISENETSIKISNETEIYTRDKGSEIKSTNLRLQDQLYDMAL